MPQQPPSPTGLRSQRQIAGQVEALPASAGQDTQFSSSSNSNMPPANLYRAPTWARNINFDNNDFDSRIGNGPSQGGPSSRHVSHGSSGSQVAMMGVALSGGVAEETDAHDQDRTMTAAESGSSSNRQRQASGGSSTTRGPAPAGMIMSHQRVASSHTVESVSANANARSTRLPDFPRSSADLYAMAPPQLSPMLTPQHERHPSAEMLGPVENNEQEANRLKRGSVLSFKTATSGGNAGFDSTPSNADFENDIERLDDAPPPKPWLHNEGALRSGPPSTFSSMQEERNIPGGWASSKASNDDLRRSPRAVMSQLQPQRKWSSDGNSPRLQLLPLDDRPYDPNLTTTREQESAAPMPPSKPDRSSIQQSSGSSGKMPSSPSFDKQLPDQPNEARTSHETSPPLPEKAQSPPSPVESRVPSAQIGATPPKTKMSPETEQTPSQIDRIDMSSLQMASRSSTIMPSDSGPSAAPAPSDAPALEPAEEPMSRQASSSKLISAPISPISDFRAKPLAELPTSSQPRDASMPYSAAISPQRNGKRSPTAMRAVVPGVGAHAANVTSSDANPAFAALMRNSSAGANAALASRVPLIDDDDSADVEESQEKSQSIDTPPREASPPPEGEVEARAEWERQQMKRMVEDSKKTSNSKRKPTFRGQLKPLQLVAAEESSRMTRDKAPSASDSKAFEGGEAKASTTLGAGAGTNADGTPSKPSHARKSGVMSTQQLQRQSAREQRRSTNNLAMGVSEVGGAYPVFTTPPADPLYIGGARQYRGLLPQRSLVPPFELQNRPDGLPSALIGPDGVRRNLNDPDICLECMMRDEDMIDVHVVGSHLWERESDRDFEEACRIEAERDSVASPDPAARARQEGSVSTHGGTMESMSTGFDSQMRDSQYSSMGRLTKIRVKRVAKGDPLTAEKLKLHTQMNPPATSHRWKTLQYYLASQAKYIANEQRARGLLPQQPSVPSKRDADPRVAQAMPGDARRAAAALLPPLTTDDRGANTPDRVGRDASARKRSAATSPVLEVAGTPLTRSRAPSTMMDVSIAEDVEDGDTSRLSPSRILKKDQSIGHQSIPRRTNVNSTGLGRAGSAQDLRSVPNAMYKHQPEAPPSPSTLLSSPSALRLPTPQAFGRSSRAASSQLSLAPSGSMIDMHVGTEDRKEHRIAQSGFLPGSHIKAHSPSAFNRAYYGFPEDGNISRNGNLEGSHDQGYEDMEAGGSLVDHEKRAEEQDRPRKKASKGIRGFFSKLSGKDASFSSTSDKKNGNDSNIAGRSMGQNGGEERRPRTSMGMDRMLDMQRPPPMSGLLVRARRSTSSLLQGGMPNGRPSMDSGMMLNSQDRGGNGVYTNPPGMGSQASLEMGPFGSGPLPPPRGESKDRKGGEESAGRQSLSFSRPSLSLGPDSAWRQRAISTGNLFRSDKRVTGDASDLPVSSRIDDADNLARNASASPTFDRNRQASAPLMNASRQFVAVNEAGPRVSMSASRNFDNETGMPRNESFAQSNGDSSRSLGAMSDSDRASGRTPRGSTRSRSNGRAMEAVDEHGTEVGSPLLPASESRRNYTGDNRMSMHGSKNGSRPPSSLLRNSSGPELDSFPPSESLASTRSSAVVSPTTPTTASRKSRFLKLPFGRNKRESVAPPAVAPSESRDESARGSRSVPDDDIFAMQQSPHGPRRQSSYSQVSSQPYSGLDASKFINQSQDQNSRMEEALEEPPAKPWYMPRRSNQIDNRAAILSALPPRSQSALGAVDGRNFAMGSQDDLYRDDDDMAAQQSKESSGKPRRGLLPRFRSSSRSALRAVNED